MPLKKHYPFFKKATEILPNDQDVWFQYGLVLSETNQKQDAIGAFKYLYQLDSTNLKAKIALLELGEPVEGYDLSYSPKSEELEIFKGSYKVEIGIQVDLSVEDAKLWVSGPEVPKESLFPLKENTFFIKGINGKLTFNFQDGTVVGFLVDTPEGTFSATKN